MRSLALNAHMGREPASAAARCTPFKIFGEGITYRTKPAFFIFPSVFFFSSVPKQGPQISNSNKAPKHGSNLAFVNDGVVHFCSRGIIHPSSIGSVSSALGCICCHLNHNSSHHQWTPQGNNIQAQFALHRIHTNSRANSPNVG
jgi:hypothetical protein